MLPFYRKQTTKNRTKLPNRSQPNSLRTTYHKLQSMVWFAARNGGGTGDGSIAQFPRSPLQHVRPRYIVSSVRVHISVRQSTPLRGDAGGEKKRVRIVRPDEFRRRSSRNSMCARACDRCCHLLSTNQPTHPSFRRVKQHIPPLPSPPFPFNATRLTKDETTDPRPSPHSSSP